jgi:hypothetical protein
MTDKKKSSTSRNLNLGEFSIRLGANVLVAILVPVLAGFIGNIATIDQVFIAGIVFIIGLLLQVSIELTALREKQQEEQRLWQILNDCDRRLSNIRLSYSNIASRGNRLYAMYFDQKLTALGRELLDAEVSGELRVDQDSNTTDIMLRSFSGAADDVIRAVHYFTDNEFMFTVHASHYFCDVANLVVAKKVREVRRLFVMTSNSELEHAQTKRLLQFHAGTKGYSYRVIQMPDFDRIKRDFNLPSDTKDFGIYANWYVYRSTVSIDSDVHGVFSSDPEIVRRFVAAFDRSWKSELATQPHVPGATPSLRELFCRDVLSPNRPSEPKIPAKPDETAKIAPPEAE